ncbi:MAG: Uma2 family endonuclease [Rhodothermales bacterium]
MQAEYTEPIVRMTYEDYVLIPEDGKRHEIIDGIEYVTAAPNVRHQRIIGRLFNRLYTYAEETGAGEVFVAPVDNILSDIDIVQPDILFVSEGRAGIIEEHGLVEAPDLVAEVLSPSNRRHDEVRKLQLYERFGAGEYWILDPERDTVTVYRLEGARYGKPRLLRAEADDRLTTPLLPDWEIPLADLFA